MAGDAGTGDDDDPGGQYAPLWKIWALLRPNLFSSGPEGDGRWEMLGMFVVMLGVFVMFVMFVVILGMFVMVSSVMVISFFVLSLCVMLIKAS